VRVVLVGPPGAGKGTQARLLAQCLDVPHISTGELFRANMTDCRPMGLEAKRYMDAGELVPDPVTLGMVRERLASDDTAKGFVLDGFPRTVSQAKMLHRLLANHGARLDAVVEFQVPRDIVLHRLMQRGRGDDTAEVIRRRQQVYWQETAPLLAHYWDVVLGVDAVGPVGEITERVLDLLRARR
jgi:adenylate kinase